jgi:hypothetical protein
MAAAASSLGEWSGSSSASAANSAITPSGLYLLGGEVGGQASVCSARTSERFSGSMCRFSSPVGADGAEPAARSLAPSVRGARSRICPAPDAEPVGRRRPFDRRGPRQRRGKTPPARVRRLPAKARRRLSAGHRDQTHPRQSLGPRLPGNQGLARNPARGTFHFRVHPEARLLAQSRRGFFSQMPRSALRLIRVASKQELKDRILAAIDDLNCDPVVHIWTYKLNEAA